MSDKIRKLKNSVVLTGKIAELEVKRGVSATNKINYVSIKGAIQFGEQPVYTRRFDTYQLEYSIDKETKERKNRKLYPRVMEFLEAAESNTVAKVGYENAYAAQISGSYEANDYVNSKEELVEGLKTSISFFDKPGAYEISPEFGTYINVEGYIKSIAPEFKGEDREETGRLRVTLLTTNYCGDIVVLKNLIVDKDNASDFSDGYEVGQTAKFAIDYVATKVAETPKKGGFGVQRSDERAYLETVIIGAKPPFDEDSEQGISREAIKIALNEREAMLSEMKAKGYQGKNTRGIQTPSVTDEDIQF